MEIDYILDFNGTFIIKIKKTKPISIFLYKNKVYLNINNKSI